MLGSVKRMPYAFESASEKMLSVLSCAGAILRALFIKRLIETEEGRSQNSEDNDGTFIFFHFFLGLLIVQSLFNYQRKIFIFELLLNIIGLIKSSVCN